jgi:hypothetical protein
MVRPDWVAVSLTTLDGVVVVLDLGPHTASVLHPLL